MDPERDRRPGRDSSLAVERVTEEPPPRKRSWLQPPRVLRATRAGWGFVAIIFGVGFAALNTGNNLLYLVLALMLAFLVLSGLLSETSLRGIHIERRLPGELFAESPNRISLRIYNAQRRAPAFAITIEDRVETEGGLHAAGRVFALRVGPEGSVDRSYVFETESRGNLRFEGFRVSTRFPFGLFVKSRLLEVPATAVVYPAVDFVPDLPRMTSPRNERDGGTRDASGDEVAGLREFVPGDSYARVHWRSSIRAGRLFVGEREGTGAAEIEVQLRLSPDATPVLVEERIKRAASEVVQHLENGFSVGLLTRSTRFAPAIGAAHRSEMLTFLALVTPGAIHTEVPLATARKQDHRPPQVSAQRADLR